MKNYLLLSMFCLLFAVSCSKSSSDDTPPPMGPASNVIPIIFHVLYENEQDRYQNLPTEVLQIRYRELNNVYSGKMFPDSASTPVNVQFQMAQYDPSGRKLVEPGINRVYYKGAASMSGNDFLASKHPEGSVNQMIFWDPNKYINIWIFGFSEERVSGISYFPYTSSSNPLPGLVSGNGYFTRQPDYMHGIVINNRHFMYVDFESSALPHEVGHYLGLYHTFSEEEKCMTPDDGADDYCTDTPKYDRAEYSQSIGEQRSVSVAPFMKTKGFIPDSYYYRISCSGKKFLATNVMDYYYCFLYRLTPQQRDRIETVLRESPLIPRSRGTKALCDDTGDLPKGRTIQ